MDLYLGGAEKSAFRTALLRAGATHLAANFTQLRIPQKGFDFDATFKGASVLLYMSEGDEDVEAYEAFVREHTDKLSVVIGCNGFDGKWLRPKLWPLWDDGDLDRLQYLMKNKGQVAVSDKSLTQAMVRQRLKAWVGQWDASVLVMSSKVDILEEVPHEIAMVTSWSSCLRFGETQVWDGRTLHRYPAQQKDVARKRHRRDITRLGVDVRAVLEDESAAVGALAIKSWMAWSARAYDPPSNVAVEPPIDDDEDEMSTTALNDDPLESGSALTDVAIAVATERHEDEVMLLPTIASSSMPARFFQELDDQGNPVSSGSDEQSVLEASHRTLRQCDSCYLAGKCPAFREGARCAYKIPVQLRTKEQLHSFLATLIELQSDRVLFAQFGELLEGQGIDSAVSTEMDRVFRLAMQLKEITDNRDVLKMTLEARAGRMSQGGVLSRLFGASAGEQARALPGGPLDEAETDNLMQTMLDV